jgi:carbamoyltransferase
VAFYDKPFLKFERLLETYLAHAPRGFRSFRKAMPLWLKEKLFQKILLGDKLRAAAPDFDWKRRLLFAEHHVSHAASAFYPSRFDDAAILTLDGVGEWATTSAGEGHGNRLALHKEIQFPHSLGLLYSAFTYFTGFRVNSGFNVRGEPIVCTPEDAFRCFMGTDIEALAIGNCYLRKEEQPAELRREYASAIESD